jgi:WD40 repeat protein
MMKHFFKTHKFAIVAKNLLMMTALTLVLVSLTGCHSKKQQQFSDIFIPDANMCFFSSISLDNKFVAIECVSEKRSDDGYAKRNLLIRDTTKTEWVPLFSDNNLPLHPLSVAFSPDTTMLAVTDTDGSLWIYKTSDWTVIQTLHSPWIQGRLSWSPDNKSLAVEGKEDIALTLLTVEGRYFHLIYHNDIFPEKEKSEPYDLAAWTITWSPDGKKIAYIVYVTSRDEIIENQIWTVELTTNKREMIAKSIVSSSRSNFVIADLGWSPDGKKIALKGHSLVQIYDIQAKEIITVFEVKGSPYTNYIPLASRMLWSPDSTQIAFYVYNGTLEEDKVYDEEGIYIITLSDMNLKIKPETRIDLIQWESEKGLVVMNYKEINKTFITLLSLVSE